MRDTQLIVREGRTSDIDDILDFFRHVRRRCITFGSEDLPDLVRRGFVFLAEVPPLLYGALIISRQSPGWGQIRAVGIIDGWPAGEGVRRLLATAQPTLQAQGIHTLYCILTESWLHAPLEAAGFGIVTRIVTYIRHAHSIPPVPESPACVRPVFPHELHDLEEVDALAFAPQWHYTWRDLARMLTTGCRIAVAVVDEIIVGYSCVDLVSEIGHIVRLVVDPEWQGRGIGRQLLIDAMRFLRNAGATRFTLNTTHSNETAIHLYESLHFRRFGRALPVMEMHLGIRSPDT